MMTAQELALRDTEAPAGVRDRLLWLDGRRLASGHRPDSADPPRCTHSQCAQAYPCTAARLADHAVAASLTGWPRSWTVRHDLHSYIRLRRLAATGGWGERR